MESLTRHPGAASGPRRLRLRWAPRLAPPLLLAGALASGCTIWSETPVDPSRPLGTRVHPLRVPTFLGFMEYMGRLRCPDGTQPHARGIPGVRPGPAGRLLDRFLLRCIYLNREVVVYVDLADDGYVERDPLPGFEMRGPPDLRRLFWMESGAGTSADRSGEPHAGGVAGPG